MDVVGAQAERLDEKAVSGREGWHGDGGVPESTNLVLGGYGTLRPRKRIAGSAVVHERILCPLRILEVQHATTVAGRDAAMPDAVVGQPRRPIGQRCFASDAERRSRDAVVAAT